MKYLNNLLPLSQMNSFGEGSRIHPVLQHYKWLEAKEQPLDFTYLSEPMTKKTFGFSASELSQLADIDKEQVNDDLSNMELIFFALSEASTELLVAERNVQTINEYYEAVKEGRRISERARQNYEKQTGIAA